jgi:hypothetical protein
MKCPRCDWSGYSAVCLRCGFDLQGYAINNPCGEETKVGELKEEKDE